MDNLHQKRDGKQAIEFTESQIPSSELTERALLGCVLTEPQTTWASAKKLNPKDFLLSLHQDVFRTIQELVREGKPIDQLLVAQRMAKDQGAVLAMGNDGVAANIEAYVREIKRCAIGRAVLRKLERINDAVGACSEQDFATMAAMLPELQRLLATETQHGAIHTLEDIPDVFSVNARSIEWLVSDLIPKGTVTVLAGDPGVGKSYLALDLARSITFGTPFLGRECEKAKVLYLDRENPHPLVLLRLEAMFGGPGLLSVWGNWLQDPPAMIGDPRLVEFAKTGLVIIFDSLIRFHTADENSATEMAAVMGHLRSLADAGATVVVLHHKSRAENSAYRGSSDILGAPDAAFALSKRDGLLELRTTKARFIAETTITIRPDFVAGRFETTDSPATTQRRDDVAAIRAVIEAQPGITQTAIVEKLHMGRTATCGLLQAHEGQQWRSEQNHARGPRGYFPVQCTEYRSVPGTPSTPAS